MEIAKKEIKQILAEASESKRIERDIFDLIFNLSKIFRVAKLLSIPFMVRL